MTADDAITQFLMEIQDELSNKYPNVDHLFVQQDIDNFHSIVNNDICKIIIESISTKNDESWCPFCLAAKIKKLSCTECCYSKLNNKCSPYGNSNTYGEILLTIGTDSLTEVVNVNKHVTNLKRYYND